MGLVDKLILDGVNNLKNASFGGVVLLVFAQLFAILLYKWLTKPKPGNNPFNKSCVRPRGPIIHEKAKRDGVIKQGFTAKKIPEQVDAVVIGSGMGGLTCAALLAKAGKKVLVLEQHDQAGGCCHTFIEKGYEFDVGIHYVGECANNTITHTLLDQITEGQLGFNPVEQEIDTIILTDPKRDGIRKIPLLSGKDVWKNKLKEMFPKEEKAIDEYFKQMRIARRCYPHSFLIKLIPKWLSALLVKSGIINLISDYPRLVNTSLKDFLNSITEDEDLKAAMSYSFGDYGTQPREAPMMMHMLLMAHYLYGGYYPIGGASEIAMNIIPVIEKHGGRVLVRADVKEIMVDQSGKACGVIVSKGGDEHKIYAPMVISAAGVINTYSRLLPPQVQEKHNLTKVLSKVNSGVGAMSIFVGLDGTNEELGLKATNSWAFTDTELDRGMDEYMALTADEAGSKDIPLLFISFPSTKDPTWDERFPGKSNCTIVTLANWSWFNEWENERIMKRGADYEEIKNRIGEKAWEQTVRLYPQLKDKRTFFDVGTPLTNKYYIGSPKGEIYGLDHNLSRFSMESCLNLRPDTPVPGLYLTGQDITSCGFAGALYAGVLTSCAILNRNLMDDLIAVNREIKAEAKRN